MVSIMETFRNDVLTILEGNICSIQFNKKDGQERTMTCTLLPKYLPEVKSARHSPDTLTVWDLDKKAWRSFRLENFVRFLTIDSGK